MAFVHGSKAAFSIADSGAVSRNISAYLVGVDFEPSVDTAETTTLGLSSKTYLTGLKDGKFSIEGKYDVTVDGYLSGILGGFLAARAFVYDPQGATTGLPRYTGTAHLTGYKVSTPVADAGTFTASFQVSGEVTRALVP